MKESVKSQLIFSFVILYSSLNSLYIALCLYVHHACLQVIDVLVLPFGTVVTCISANAMHRSMGKIDSHVII